MRFVAQIMTFVRSLWRDDSPAHLRRIERRQDAVDLRLARAERRIAREQRQYRDRLRDRKS